MSLVCVTRFTTHTRLNDDDDCCDDDVDEEAPFLLAKKIFGGARAAWNLAKFGPKFRENRWLLPLRGLIMINYCFRKSYESRWRNLDNVLYTEIRFEIEEKQAVITIKGLNYD